MSTESLIYLILTLCFAGYYLYLKSQKGKDIDRSILKLKHRYNLYRKHKGELTPDDNSLLLSYLSYLFRLSSWKGKRDLAIILLFIGGWTLETSLFYKAEDVASAAMVAMILCLILPYGMGFTWFGRRTRQARELAFNKGIAFIWAAFFLQNIQEEIYTGSIILLFLSAVAVFEGTKGYAYFLYKPSKEALDKGYVRRKPLICTEPMDDLIY